MSKTALITGASAGIGRELAIHHAAAGGNLVITARREDRLNQLKADLKKTYAIKVMIIVKDLIQPGAPIEIYNEIKKAGIEIDYLVNNAGFGGRGNFHERDMQTDLEMIQLNIVALTALTGLFLPDFVKRGYGRILNVSSIACLIPGPLHAVYYATKAYVTSFSNALAAELHNTPITVTALLPGMTKTEFFDKAVVNKTRLYWKMAEASAVARTGYNGMLRGRLNVAAGLSAGTMIMIRLLLILVPKKLLIRQIRKMNEAFVS